MANSIKADVVVTYPSEDGEWSVLKLTTFEAQFLRQALEQTLGPKNGTVHIAAGVLRNGDRVTWSAGETSLTPAEDPGAYAE